MKTFNGAFATSSGVTLVGTAVWALFMTFLDCCNLFCEICRPWYWGTNSAYRLISTAACRLPLRP